MFNQLKSKTMKKFIFLLSLFMTMTMFGFGLEDHESNNKDGTTIEKSLSVEIVKSCDFESPMQNTFIHDQDVGMNETRPEGEVGTLETTIVKKVWKHTSIEDKVPKKTSKEILKANDKSNRVFGTSGGNPGRTIETTL